MNNITIKLPVKLKEKLDELYNEGWINSRSQFITSILFLWFQEWEKEKIKCGCGK